MKAAEIKIGYVDTAVIMQKAPQAESAVRKIESEFAPRDNELAEKQKKIAKLEDDLVRDGDVMSNKERRNLIQEVRSLKREQRRLQEEFREEFTMRRNELQNEITLVVIKAIKTIAKMENYDLIIDTAIHAGKRVDITSKVISQLKTDFKEQK
uniref:Periplasmic chaperone for outer membrane proteins Skp n=1 Tax=Candidatus Kentrum sp. TUN TaxID=2126343 RepID=A0A451A321_9GAMM|nr:MAG: periplasmic chaperone for outer membrane proteins Skp [Candidatus Kentron sp. TUN]VFK55357.1 MAG: periplasmic chaperone for outer membrane proteins Skp [Candidatus Kentron sp. TUN]VFK60435.1 MAG: periplasmic chaperone for outer membrane proteins Skp [Candidatus Kentron sp. TUN]